jgi:hypothetical protein
MPGRTVAHRRQRARARMPIEPKQAPTSVFAFCSHPPKKRLTVLGMKTQRALCAKLVRIRGSLPARNAIPALHRCTSPSICMPTAWAAQRHRYLRRELEHLTAGIDHAGSSHRPVLFMERMAHAPTVRRVNVGWPQQITSRPQSAGPRVAAVKWPADVPAANVAITVAPEHVSL